MLSDHNTGASGFAGEIAQVKKAHHSALYLPPVYNITSRRFDIVVRVVTQHRVMNGADYEG